MYPKIAANFLCAVLVAVFLTRLRIVCITFPDSMQNKAGKKIIETRLSRLQLKEKKPWQ
jgi:hypothetical protein